MPGRADEGVCPYVVWLSGDEGDAGELAAEVGGVALAVLGVVQDGVDVMEDVPLRDGAVAVAGKASGRVMFSSKMRAPL